MKLNDVCRVFIFKVGDGNVMIFVVGVSSGEHCTHIRTQRHRGCYKGQSEALVLLHCCYTCAVFAACTVAARLLFKSRGTVNLYRPAPSAQHSINCTSHEITCSFLFLTSTGNIIQTRTHTDAPSVAVTREETSLMCDCCCTVAATK